MKNQAILIGASVLLTACPALQCQENKAVFPDVGIHFEDASIKGWATSCKIIRGYLRIDEKHLGKVSAGDEKACLGKADNLTVSLGDSGTAVVSFSEPFKNIPGYDFAVFENSFDGRFLELAFVEVSSDSMKWIRFPAKTLIPSEVQTGTYGITDPALIHNLAGKHRAYYGTPFDLGELKDSAGIDLENIRYVRITDVTGTINPLYASRDAYGNIINDPFPTPFPQGGFDLDAVAVLKSPAKAEAGYGNAEISVFPNPASEFVNFLFQSECERLIVIADLYGKELRRLKISDQLAVVNVNDLAPGLYILQIKENGKRFVYRLIII